jgi:hypothetical protein
MSYIDILNIMDILEIDIIDNTLLRGPRYFPFPVGKGSPRSPQVEGLPIPQGLGIFPDPLNWAISCDSISKVSVTYLNRVSQREIDKSSERTLCNQI